MRPCARYLRGGASVNPRHGRGAAATRLHGLPASRPRRSREPGPYVPATLPPSRVRAPRTIRLGAAAAPRCIAGTVQLERPRRRRDASENFSRRVSSPRNFQEAAAAPSRRVEGRFKSTGRGGAAIHQRTIHVASRLRGISRKRPRRRRAASKEASSRKAAAAPRCIKGLFTSRLVSAAGSGRGAAATRRRTLRGRGGAGNHRRKYPRGQRTCAAAASARGSPASA